MNDQREKDAAGSGGRGADVHRDGQPDADDTLDLCVREFAVRAMSEAPGERWIDVIASTDAIDSYDEIVEQTWDLSRFNANPVILWAHQSRELTLGSASMVRVEDGKLQMRLNFCDADYNPKGPQVYAGFKQKHLRAVSVGFIPRDVRAEMRDGREVYVLSNNLLLEISPTPIGANPEALAKSHARIKAMAARAPASLGNSNESPAAERGDHMENVMTNEEKAALDAAEKRATDAEKKAQGLEALLKKAIGLAVKSLVEAGRFAQDEIEEQTELAEKSFDLFERMAAKRTIRGAEIVNVKKLPDPPTGGVGAPHGDNAGADVDLLNEEGA